MKNFVQTGDVLSLLAPYDVAAGAGFKVGSIIAVATSAALSGAAVEGAVVGVFDVAKVSAQAWTVGANNSLVNVGSGKCLDATGPSSADGTRLQIWTCAGSANQAWTLS